MHALQLYTPKANAEEYRNSIRLAANWLANAHSYNNEDRSWRVAGLAWAGTNKAATQQAVKELLAAQHPDGGWSDLPTMQSTAYATGKSLVALHLAGLPASSPAYQRGVKLALEHTSRKTVPGTCRPVLSASSPGSTPASRTATINGSPPPAQTGPPWRSPTHCRKAPRRRHPCPESRPQISLTNPNRPPQSNLRRLPRNSNSGDASPSLRNSQ